MGDLSGQRVFFKRRALRLLRGYWCRRWDNLPLREALSLNYEPRYHVEAEHLGGFYVSLRGSPFLWFRGLFSVGRHLPSGRYIQAPVEVPVAGLGPRELVFPRAFTERLDDLPLLGTWYRYQRAAGREPVAPPHPWPRHAPRPARLRVRVQALVMATPPPLDTGWRARAFARPTLCLDALGHTPPLAGARLLVPLSEVFWNGVLPPPAA